ncbi:Tyrosine specific protein phosphatases domain-containing protein OS=Eoetvoesiella caeni OX=645616 GN=DFR37_1261 PE=4 SV=1 [Eoetvoesiella caeni]|uniref:Tyrosine specific protein phosphatases domain-containing protein n=2 Tax=Eoetvoesiella caeni TaxID=645616 RepID=A0A366GYD9_9BURK|nr:hypothetical protein DFR37_1261 [Eoetvoesiella caeni]
MLSSSVNAVPKKQVHFISQRDAECLSPIPGAAMISITDPDKSEARLGNWDFLYRDSFYDGGYSENTINTMKGAFRLKYASYIDSKQAQDMVDYLAKLVDRGVSQVYVHCYFGVSRSGAIAMYLRDNYGFVENKEITKPNLTVLRLLQDPQRYEALIQGFEPMPVVARTSFHQKVLAAILAAVRFKG